MKKRIWMVMCLVLLFISGCKGAAGTYFEEATERSEGTETVEDAAVWKDTEETAASTAESTQKSEDCYVYVCGAVVCPGVYQLPAGSRIYEAILMAGGLREDACEDSINQAMQAEDGQMIKVLTKEEAEWSGTQTVSKGQSGGEKDSDGRININTADMDTLMTLPGIGEAKAMSIISYREEQGGFSSIEELMNITGIKEGVYSEIKDNITVN